MNTNDIKAALLTSIRNDTGYEIDDNTVDGIAKWIASGGNRITQQSLVYYLSNALEKVADAINDETIAIHEQEKKQQRDIE